MVSYQIHPVADLFPMMNDAEIQGLADDIKANGLREPVVFHDGVLLDGRNRVKACKLIGIDPRVKLWDGEGDPTNWIVSMNYHRRHMSESQRAMVARELKRLIFAPAAKERQREGQAEGGRKHGKLECASASIEAKATTLGKAAEQAATMLNVSGGSVERAERVCKRAIPALQEAVTKGEMSLGAADLLSTLSVEEQAELANDPVRAKKRVSELRKRKEKADPFPEPSKPHARKPSPRTTRREAFDEQVADLCEEGKGTSDIAEVLGVDPHRVSEAKRRLGLTRICQGPLLPVIETVDAHVAIWELNCSTVPQLCNRADSDSRDRLIGGLKALRAAAKRLQDILQEV